MMKKVWKLIIVSIGIVLASTQMIQAQETGDMILNLNYSPSFPLGGFKDNIVGKTSWKSYSGDLMYHFADKWSAGLGFAYQGFEEKTPRATYSLNGSDVNGVVNTRVNMYPILAKAQYSPLGGTSAVIRPYVQLGAGLAIVDFDQYLGMYSVANRTTGRFMAQGGIGFSVPFGKLTSNGLQFGANYNYVNYDGRFTNQAGNVSKVNNLGNVSAYVGVHFMLR